MKRTRKQRPECFGLWLGLLLMAGSPAYAGETARAPQDAPDKPNIVFILVDSLRARNLSCYGYPRPTTPYIDSLAAGGIRFENFFANSSWTAPAVGNVFTGLSSLRHGRNRVADPLRENLPSLAGVLRAAGYHTLAVTCNAVAGSQWGYERGFAVFDDFSLPRLLEAGLPPEAKPADAAERLQTLIAAPGVDDKLTAIALRRMEDIPPDAPYFLFVQLYDPHWDYRPLPRHRALFADSGYAGEMDGTLWQLQEIENGGRQAAPEDIRHLVDLYDAEIRQTDDAIRRLVTTLQERGRLKDTDVIIISGDHGEEFFEHGVGSHGKNLFDPSVKVPAIVRAPGRLPAGVATDAPASHFDWLPTLAGLAGVATPAGLPGADLFTFKDGEWSPPEREGVFMHVMLDEPRARPLVAYRTKDTKIIRRLDDDSVVVHDLAADPDEQHPLPVDARPDYAGLLEKLDAWHAEERRRAGPAGPDKEGRP